MCWFQAFVFLVGWSPMSLSLDSPGFTWIHLDFASCLPSSLSSFVRQCDQRCSNEVCRHGKSTESTESTVQALHVSWRSVLREAAPTWYRWRHRSPGSAGYEKNTKPAEVCWSLVQKDSIRRGQLNLTFKEKFPARSLQASLVQAGTRSTEPWSDCILRPQSCQRQRIETTMQCSKISTFLFLQLEVLAKLGPATQKEMQGKMDILSVVSWSFRF